MSKRYLNKTLYVAVVAALYANVGQAQQQPAPVAQQGELESVIVTGSYIRGTPEDSALPVDVVTAEDLAEQGSPTVVQLVKTITASQSAIGESNRYNVGAGTAQINLRGFGAARSLVLMNGRRLSDNPIAAGQNLNFIPSAAVGRVEILKDGAAATYGSDAVGGVINFITRTDLDGVELNGEYSAIDGSDGDYQGSVAWGSKFDGGGNVLLTLGYRHRSRLDVQDRDWALARYDDLGYGGWTGAGNPGVYVQNTTSNAPPTLFRDNGCTELGGQLTTGALGQPTSSTAIGSTCRYQFATFNDIVNIEDHYQVHGEANFPVGDGTKFHGEMTWARDYVPQQRLSPANLSTQFPTPTTLGGTSGSIQTPGALNFFVRNNVPANNPGLADLVANCATSGLALGAGQTCGTLAAAVAAGGVDISQTTWRAIAHAGHPTNKDKADRQTVDSKAFRISAGLSGEVFETLNWDTAFTYMNSRSDVGTNDLLVDRIQLALNGFGQNVGDTGDGCTAADRAALGTTSTVAQHNARGCFFFNPFTNSIAVSAVNGQANPYYRGGANPAVNNTPELVEWLYGHYDNKFSAGIFVTDAVVSGPTGLELPGGDLAFALGTQFRYTTDKNEYGDLFNNRVNPCVDSIDDDTPVCGAPAGPLIFFGSNNNSEYTRSVWAGFGELQIPVLDSLDFSLALRYESYPGELGSTTDPKLSVRWQALDWFALRGSIGTTFRAPTPTQVDPGCSTGVANIGGQYRAVETCGNSALKPETADAINLGLIFNPGNFTATLDYFKFKFEGELINESSSRLYATMFPTGVALTVPGPGGVGTVPNLNHPCNNSGFLPLKNRFQFAGGVCDPTQVLRIQVNTVNGPSTDTSGFDLRLQYDWRQALGGSVSLGAEATYLIEYARGAFTLKGTSVEFAAPEDRAGKHDLTAQFFSYPQLRGNLFVSYRWQDLSVRLQSRYTEGTEGAFGTPLKEWVRDANAPPAQEGWSQRDIGKTDDYIQHDLIARYATPWNATVGFSIQNLLDEDPSDAPGMYNYDYTNGNPLGRVFEVSLQAKF